MNRRMIFAAVAMFVFTSATEAAEFKSLAARNAQRDYRNAVAKAEADFEAAKESAKAEYAASLKTAQDAATKAADLDDALAIRAERERVEGGGGFEGGVASNNADKDDGTPKITYAVWGNLVSPSVVQSRVKENSRGWAISTKGIVRQRNPRPGLFVLYRLNGEKSSQWFNDETDIIYRR